MAALPKYVIPDPATVEIELRVPSQTYRDSIVYVLDHRNLSVDPSVAAYHLSQGMAQIGACYDHLAYADDIKAEAASGGLRNSVEPCVQEFDVSPYNPPNQLASALGYRFTHGVLVACQLIDNAAPLCAHRERINDFLPRLDALAAELRMMDRGFSRRVQLLRVYEPIIVSTFDLCRSAMHDLHAAGAGHCLPAPMWFHTHSVDNAPFSRILPPDLWPESPQEPPNHANPS